MLFLLWKGEKIAENNQIFECENCGGEFEKIQEGKYKCKFCGFVKEIQTSTSGEILSLLNDAGRLRKGGERQRGMGHCTMYKFNARPHITSKQKAHYCSPFPLMCFNYTTNMDDFVCEHIA